MKKCLALLLCLMTLMPLALAETVPPVYTEDFEDGEHDFYYWGSEADAQACKMTIETDENGNHYLKCLNSTGEGENGYIHFLFGPDLRNFDYTCRVSPFIKNPDHNWMKVLFRAEDAKTAGKGRGDGGENESYMFNIWEWRGVFTIKSLTGRKSESKALVENQDFWFDNGEWYNLRIEARDTNVKVYVNGELCADYTDEADVRPNGIFGFCAWGANFDIDDIVIYSLD